MGRLVTLSCTSLNTVRSSSPCCRGKMTSSQGSSTSWRSRCVSVCESGCVSCCLSVSECVCVCVCVRVLVTVCVHKGVSIDLHGVCVCARARVCVCAGLVQFLPV